MSSEPEAVVPLGQPAAAVSHAAASAQGSLARRFTEGALWLSLALGAERLMAVVRIITLGRLLLPEHFGVFALGGMVESLLGILTQTGLRAALVRCPGDVRGFLGPVLGVQIYRSAACGLGMLLAALMITVYPAAFGNDEHANGGILAAMALPAVLQCLVNPGIVVLEKQLSFHVQTIMSMSGVAADAAVAIALAMVWRSPWALVAGAVVGALVRTTLSYALTSVRALPEFQFDQIRSLARFGFWVWFAGVTSYAALYAERWIIAGYLGASALGVYFMAARVPDLTLATQGRLVGSLMYATYASVSNDPNRLRRLTQRTFGATVYLLLPIVVLLITQRVAVTNVLFGPSWHEVATPLGFLAVSSALRVVIMQFAYLSRAMNQAHLDAWLSLLRGVASCSLAAVWIRWYGLPGAAAASVASLLIVLPFYALRTNQFVLDSWKEWLQLALPVVGGLLASLAVAANCAGCWGDGTAGLVLRASMIATAYLIPGMLAWRMSNSGPLADIADVVRARLQRPRAGAQPRQNGASR